jgi:hypothetical protein
MSAQAGGDRQYPAQRAFVVQFGRRSGAARDEFTGRVEHVASGTAGHFDAAEELLAFFGRVLGEQDHGASGGRPRPPRWLPRRRGPFDGAGRGTP